MKMQQNYTVLLIDFCQGYIKIKAPYTRGRNIVRGSNTVIATNLYSASSATRRDNSVLYNTVVHVVLQTFYMRQWTNTAQHK